MWGEVVLGRLWGQLKGGEGSLVGQVREALGLGLALGCGELIGCWAPEGREGIYESFLHGLVIRLSDFFGGRGRDISLDLFWRKKKPN